MPVLKNARHEKFAQAVAAGKTATEAHGLAGYKINDGNASKLAKLQEVQARIQEITGNAAFLVARTVAIDKAWVLERLVRNAEKALETKGGGNVANRALELIGKEFGMFIERHEHGQPGEFDFLNGMSTDELRDFFIAQAQADGILPETDTDSGRTRAPGEKLN